MGALLFVSTAAACSNPAGSATTAPAATPAPSAVAATSIAATTASTQIVCGIYKGSDHVSGSATTPAIYLVAVSPTSDVGFAWPGLRGAPEVGAYMCAHLRQGTSNLIFDSIIDKGEPGYITQP
ncbi:MAG TPA: hypothetical protein VEU77_05660 [Candidatus Acidoferrales bacterium]|nr:hypothetical protein [Candidatus Acidoferrales bacterium]